MHCLHFLLLVNVSSIGTGCGVVGMWGNCSPIRLPIRNPDKAFGTRCRGRGSEWVAGLLPVEHAHVDRSDMPPVDTGALATQSHEVTS